MLHRHVLESCPGAGDTRAALGISNFLEDCKAAGCSKAAAAKRYINGKDASGASIGRAGHLSRGADLRALQDSWLSGWE